MATAGGLRLAWRKGRLGPSLCVRVPHSFSSSGYSLFLCSLNLKNFRKIAVI